MREFSIVLKNFVKGLKPSSVVGPNSELAQELVNIRCGRYGLESPPVIIFPDITFVASIESEASFSANTGGDCFTSTFRPNGNCQVWSHSGYRILVGIDGDYTYNIYTGFYLPIAQGTEIVRATYIIRIGYNKPDYHDTCYTKVYVSNEDNCPYPSNCATYNGINTIGGYDWDFETYSQNETYELDLTSDVQQVINREGWSQGNRLAVLIKDDTPPEKINPNYYNYMSIYDSTYSSTYAAHLEVVWVESSPIESLNWPFPQLVKIMSVDDLDTGIYAVGVYESYAYVWKIDSDWGSEIMVSAPIGASETRFTFADFGFYQVWAGSGVVFERKLNASNQIEWSVFEVPSGMTVNAVTNFRGQLILGLSVNLDSYVTDNYVVWSEIGNANLSELLDPDRSFIPDSYKNEAGSYRLGKDSQVVKLIPLDNGVMVYCTNQILYLKAVSSPVVGFGIIKLADFGISSNGCAEGDEKGHVFIDTENRLWRIGQDLKLDLLDYSNYIQNLNSDDIVISCDQLRRDFYITDGSVCYLLTQIGLSEVRWYPTSLILHNGQLIAGGIAGDLEEEEGGGGGGGEV